MPRNLTTDVSTTVPESLARRLRHLAAIVTSTMMLVFCATGNAQNIAQLADAVQLRELETPTDDLIRLSTSYADALREFKVAKLSIETVRAMPPSAVVTNLELQIANLNLEAAERKVRILRAIVEKQLAAAKNKLAIVTHMEKLGNSGAAGNGAGVESNFIRAQDEATVQILQMILEMR